MGRIKDLLIKQHEEALEAENSRFNALMEIIDEDEEKIDDWEAWKREEQAHDKAEEEKQEITLEELRKILADISRSGKTTEVKAILTKYGYEKLNQVNPKDYKAILIEAQELK